MRILGISTAAGVASFGLIDEEKVLAEGTLSGNIAEKILFYVKEAGIEPKDIDGISVAVGPGSYSGLRAGVATAKTLAQTLSIPIVGVPTLDAIAYNFIDVQGTIAVILDARSDEYNFALFGASNGKLNRLTDDIVIKLDRLADKLKKITGNIYLAGKLSEIKERIVGDNFHFADETNSYPYGINVAKIGLALIKSGKTDDPIKLVPNYSHKPNIREYKKA